jgi:anti-anti-sigma factor
MDEGLRTSRRRAPAGTCVLVLTGQADLGTAAVLARALTAALEGPPVPRVLTVDCAGLDLCASAGLNELLKARQRAVAAGIAFRLAAPSAQVLRLLRLTGADAAFEVTAGARPADPLLP